MCTKMLLGGGPTDSPDLAGGFSGKPNAYQKVRNIRTAP